MNIERAIEIAVEAHKGVLDKGGNPYVLHPLRMMFTVNTEEEKIVAVCMTSSKMLPTGILSD